MYTGTGEGDIQASEEVLKPCLKAYPEVYLFNCKVMYKIWKITFRSFHTPHSHIYHFKLGIFTFYCGSGGWFFETSF